MPEITTAFGTVYDLMSLSKSYLVPKYQRKYSWKADKQVKQLWLDVVRLYRAQVPDAQAGHFIGPVVIGQPTDPGLSHPSAPIIDGQQRLVTLSLMIAAVRDVLVDDEEEAFEITKTYLRHTRVRELTDPKVQPGLSDIQTFNQVINGLQVTDRRSLVYKAYEYICNQLRLGLAREDDEDAVDESGTEIESDREPAVETGAAPEVEEFISSGEPWDWRKLLLVIGQKLELVSISGVAPERAYQVFASLNYAGTRLNQVDLIRNAVFMLLPTRGDEAHDAIWRPLEDALGALRLEQFIHAWVIRAGFNVPRKDTYAALLLYVKQAGSSEDAVYDALQNLHRDAWTYLLATSPSDDRSRAVFGSGRPPRDLLRSLERLASWGNTVPLEPVLLEVIGRWRSDRLTADKARYLVEMLESFVVRRYIAEVPPNDLRSSLARLVSQVATASDSAFIETFLDALKEDMRRWHSDDHIKRDMRTRPLYRRNSQPRCFFILKRIAEALEGRECPAVHLGTTRDDYSIEHVLPQTPSQEWKQDLANWGDPDVTETIEQFTHVAGNLTLTAYNPEMSNSRFEVKRGWIRDAMYLKLSKQVLECDKWTRAEIDERSALLAGKVVTIWPRP